MNITIIGLGLIGGSFAKALRKNGFAEKLIGVDSNVKNQKLALDLQLVHEIQPLTKSLSNADVVIIAIPVDASVKILPNVLDNINDTTVVFDVGSTKAAICEAAEGHPRRKNFVASHPIAGTEFSGPSASTAELFENKTVIICDQDRSARFAINHSVQLFNALNMKVITMQSDEHDLHIAYVSHLSHITSFVLGETVLEKEKEVEHIFNMAGSGFASTVRLAKSSPDMWAPIFLENAANISDVLSTYITNLQNFKNMIDRKDAKELKRTMKSANEIRKVI